MRSTVCGLRYKENRKPYTLVAMAGLVKNHDHLDRPLVHTFKRREILPLEANLLWQIQSGAVRLLTLSEEGTPITLGFWESGDLTGQPLICIQPSEIECLTNVSNPDWSNLGQWVDWRVVPPDVTYQAARSWGMAPS